ncbi:MAG: bifunctional aspartate kinase/homoserine dehydrogenase I [Treponema sp.]|uniref:bifunctional aspartate kinase/homoserine dehydrogenase I n=1 Tax=Treponema sp. TaxID=166 RepID=UPI001B42D6DE|nr:bifunctional aspartate kinase/homoserine dehydrogenase I [Treponema sp.]MBP5402285.1 bifunctional aspartate kinase/homoserine dehydrogenase I [Treponema sp.]MBR5933217.1 bifunctional aspartate kinase/homoserine dehydrogenase I [Treponema sp.]
MITLKFGGTSMANARRILASADIILNRAKEDRLSVVVSAAAGVSNTLQSAIEATVAGISGTNYVTDIRNTHKEICNELQSKLPGFDSEKVMASLEDNFVELEKLLAGCVSFGECPDTVYCRIMGMGELLSAPIMEAVLIAKKQSVILLDSRKFVFTQGNQKEGEADYALCNEACAPFRDGASPTQTRILLFPGFICTWKEGMGAKPVMGLLGRNGSDFSAAIIGASLRVKRVEFWTDVDGVFTADPRVVKDAILVDDMSYEEAMELSFFGSKVLHPKTIAPLQAKGIEAWSLNSHNPSARGTRISQGPFESRKKSSICGISSLKHVSMVSVGGSLMRGRTGMASKIFSAVSASGTSILLITQSSSEYTISFCVRDDEASKVVDSLEKKFELEIREKLIDEIDVRKDCAIISVVGDGMISNRGIASKFMNALSSQDINILAIAQGSSERCISAVISGEYADTAVKAVHRFFFKTAQSIEVFAFGAGTIGGTMIDQIHEQHDKLLKENVDIKVLAITTIDGMILNEDGIDLSNWREQMKKPQFAFGPQNVDDIIKFVKEKKPLNPVFVDCTASYDLPERYLDIINAGMSIATPNKRANSMDINFYHELRRTANKMHRRFLYETNVGAGLPIIDTLQNLYKSGDKLESFNGIMSGSLSYIFGKLDEGVKFSQAVKEAKELRYTEPDPRDDLEGKDVARKALIIARESGYDIELTDIELIPVFPKTFDATGTVDEFMANLSKVDDYFEKKMEELKKKNMVLRMGATIKNGKASVGMMEVPVTDPLYSVKGGENAFVFYTERYQPIPLTVRGYGAGAGVTAAGVFGDILRTVSFNMER